MRTLSMAVAAVLLGGSALLFSARAQVEPDKIPKPEIHVNNYGEFDRTCARWSDSCRVCTRDGCSNIGVACQPQEVTCLEPQPAGKEGK